MDTSSHIPANRICKILSTWASSLFIFLGAVKNLPRPTVEPILFMDALAFGLTNTAIRVLIYDKVCIQITSLPIHSCVSRNLTDAEQDAVKADASRWEFYRTVTSILPALLLMAFYAGLLDRWSKRLTMLFCPVGTILNLLVLLTAASDMSSSQAITLIGSLVVGLTGGATLLSGACYSYLIVECENQESSRAVRIAFTEAFQITSRALSYYLSGVLFEIAGYHIVFSLGIGINVFLCIYIVFYLREQNLSYSKEEKHKVDNENDCGTDVHAPRETSASMLSSETVEPQILERSRHSRIIIENRLNSIEDVTLISDVNASPTPAFEISLQDNVNTSHKEDPLKCNDEIKSDTQSLDHHNNQTVAPRGSRVERDILFGMTESTGETLHKENGLCCVDATSKYNVDTTSDPHSGPDKQISTDKEPNLASQYVHRSKVTLETNNYSGPQSLSANLERQLHESLSDSQDGQMSTGNKIGDCLEDPKDTLEGPGMVSGRRNALRDGLCYMVTLWREYIGVVLVKRVGHKREALCYLLIIIGIEVMCIRESMFGLSYLYLTHEPIYMSSVQYGFFTGLSSTVRAGCLFILLPVCKRILKLSDVTLLLLGLTSALISITGLGASVTTWMAFASLILAIFQPMTVVAARCLCVLCVESSERGKLFGMISSLESLMALIGSAVFNFGIYPATVGIYPGTSILILAALLLIPLSLAWFKREKLRL